MLQGRDYFFGLVEFRFMVHEEGKLRQYYLGAHGGSSTSFVDAGNLQILRICMLGFHGG